MIVVVVCYRRSRSMMNRAAVEFPRQHIYIGPSGRECIVLKASENASQVLSLRLGMQAVGGDDRARTKLSIENFERL